MKRRSLITFLILSFAASTQAQQSNGIVAEGGSVDDYASTRVLYWNPQANAAAGQFAINYGRPVWRKDYEDAAKFDPMTKGKVWRMGKNFWSMLETDLPLNIGGKEIQPGSYCLGLYRSDDGAEWSLAFIDPAKVRHMHLDAFDILKAPVDFKAPMSVSKSDKPVEKLTITLSHPTDKIQDVTMHLAWGNMHLTAPIQVTVGN